MSKTLTVALVRDLFPVPSRAESLTQCLVEARRQGAELAVLPELPYNIWSPATPNARADDAEGSRGWRISMQHQAARTAKIAVLGGVIRRLKDGTRLNLAVMSDAGGNLAASYAKVHLPAEPGFHECDHYAAGNALPLVNEVAGARVGVQICSDAFRPSGSQILAAQGVQVILAPRATSATSYERWRLIYRAMALSCAAWVVSVGRPGPENGVPIGGPALVVDPDGEVTVETEDRFTVTAIDLAAAERAFDGYPGYLAIPAEAYASFWLDLCPEFD